MIIYQSFANLPNTGNLKKQLYKIISFTQKVNFCIIRSDFPVANYPIKKNYSNLYYRVFPLIISKSFSI